MATATNTTAGQILLSGDLTGTGENPELRASGVVPRAYNTSIGTPNSTGLSVSTVPKFVVDSKGRIVYASAVSGNLQFPIATTSTNGLFRVDGTSITISGGVMSSTTGTPPIATSSVNGIVKGGGGTTTGVVFDDPGEPNYPMFAIPAMRADRRGQWKPDRASVLINDSGVASINLSKATSSTIGAVKPDNTSIAIDTNGTISLTAPLATSSTVGLVKPDGASIAVNGSGTLTAIANVAVATSSTLGSVRPDNSTITVSSGILSASIASASSTGVVKLNNSDLILNGNSETTLNFQPLYISGPYAPSYITFTSPKVSYNDSLVNMNQSGVYSIGDSGLYANTVYITITGTVTETINILGFLNPDTVNYVGANIRFFIRKAAGVPTGTKVVFKSSNTTTRKGKFYIPGPLSVQTGDVDTGFFAPTLIKVINMFVYNDGGTPTGIIINQSSITL